MGVSSPAAAIASKEAVAALRAVRKKPRLFGAIFILFKEKRSIYPDRLGTNTGKAESKRRILQEGAVIVEIPHLAQSATAEEETATRSAENEGHQKLISEGEFALLLAEFGEKTAALFLSIQLFLCSSRACRGKSSAFLIDDHGIQNIDCCHDRQGLTWRAT